MADQERDYEDYDLRQANEIGDRNQYGAADYTEETSAEIAAPISLDRGRTNTLSERDNETETAGRGMGIAALVLSIISLFVFPVLFGATGIVLGFVARRRGALSLGSWAIGIGVVSIIVGMFILPFF
ncbi:DUF4190 domain-containing protein [Bacillus sp. DTU_2020_1000418_1_SI_GHA_SEK_038]|uniref:DUF4190 domain-containing protein n=1 Tax=Bacillus sp. DTU_2020_1000418_1_SI_GHA_SEK_038 TaxID=3077585 RepID=UPI0028E96C9D|nr:DUF4190 domain-containing protein [Bacillus sp. DTU_2020_1000418_1_SI_GHA_SEK_038]WNS74315.1 DUF4190 domain-containing protein [Bacillus sp. DTU_2020_1000418_1_SI_GHA_SEK_038]